MINGVRESNSQYAPATYSERDPSVKHGPGSSRTGIQHHDDLLHPTVPLKPTPMHSGMAVYIVLMTNLTGLCRAPRRPENANIYPRGHIQAL